MFSLFATLYAEAGLSLNLETIWLVRSQIFLTQCYHTQTAMPAQLLGGFCSGDPALFLMFMW